MLAKKFRLQLKNRIKSGKERKYKYFILKIASNGLGFSRFGAVLSQKTNKSSVQRNKLKRIIFDFFRNQKTYLNSGKDILIIGLPPIAKADKGEIEKELSEAVKEIYG